MTFMQQKNTEVETSIADGNQGPQCHAISFMTIIVINHQKLHLFNLQTHLRHLGVVTTSPQQKQPAQ